MDLKPGETWFGITFSFIPSKLSYSYRTTINHLSTLKRNEP